MQFHLLDRDIARNMARGMSDDEAYFAAHRSFGNVTATAELARDAMRWSWLEQLGQDIRYSLRTLKRNPGFTTIAVASLALGIGANTAIFTIINALSLRTLPASAPEELVTFRTEKATSDVWRHQFWYQQYEKFRDQTTAFSSVAAVCTLDRFGMKVRHRNRRVRARAHPSRDRHRQLFLDVRCWRNHRPAAHRSRRPRAWRSSGCRGQPPILGTSDSVATRMSSPAS